MELISRWDDQPAGTVCTPKVRLKDGPHRLVLEYRERTGNASIVLRRSPADPVDCSGATTVVAATELQPGYLNQTSVVSPSNGSSGGNARVAFTHFDKPWTAQPDYTLTRVGASDLVTALEYDAFGLLVRRTLPKGNVGRLDANGSLSGSPNTAYSVSWAYYEAGAITSPPTPCTGPQANQRGLLQSLARPGVMTVTTVHDAAGRPVAITNGAGTTCKSYDAEGRLTSEKAPGDPQQTTYVYDPAGALLTATDASGTVSTIYDEAGRPLDTVDSFGAELEHVHDLEGNVVRRRVATGSHSGSTVYETTNAYDDENRLTQITDPAGRVWKPFWDAAGRLKAIDYPNGTFSWNDYHAGGWLQAVYNRHGDFAALPGGVPADSGPGALSDFVYAYRQNGQRSSETRTGQGLGGGETTSFTYDELGRLVGSAGAVPRTYCYDLNSNRTAHYLSGGATCGQGTPEGSYAYSATALDRLESVTRNGEQTTYGYTADGQVSTRGPETMSWDGWGRHSAFSAPSLAGVQFSVDGQPHGAEDTTSPYGTSLDASTLSTGTHTIGAIARNRQGKQAQAKTVVVSKGTVSLPPPSSVFVKNLGTASTVASGSTVSLTVPAGGVVVGHTVILATSMRGGTGVSLTSVSDSRGNTYTIDSSARDSTVNIAAFLASARATTALQAGDTITATYNTSSTAPRLVTAAEFENVAINRVDSTPPVQTGIGTFPYTGYVTVPAGGRLLVGYFGIARYIFFGPGDFTPGASFAGYAQASGGSGSASQKLAAEWRLALSGTQNADGRLSAESAWAGNIVSYRLTSESTPPSAPGTPAVTVTPGTELSWAASTDASGIKLYTVHRSTSSGFTPGPGTRVADTTLTAFTDSGLASGTYYYRVTATDHADNTGSASAQSSAATVTADAGLPSVAVTAPVDGASVSGTVSLTASASDPAGMASVSYGFDPLGFRRSRTLDGATTRYLLGGVLEATPAGVITGFDVDGPAGDLARYPGAPTGAQPVFLYYSGQGDLAAEADGSGARTGLYRYDPFGEPLAAPRGAGLLELFTGAWDKKHDPASGLVEMGVRPYDPALGRFLTVDPIQGGALNGYDYAGQDAVLTYDLSGLFAMLPDSGGLLVAPTPPINSDLPGPSTKTRIAGAGLFAAGSVVAVQGAAAWLACKSIHRTYAELPFIYDLWSRVACEHAAAVAFTTGSAAASAGAATAWRGALPWNKRVHTRRGPSA